jgi:hypothetical protein
MVLNVYDVGLIVLVMILPRNVVSCLDTKYRRRFGYWLASKSAVCTAMPHGVSLGASIYVFPASSENKDGRDPYHACGRRPTNTKF